MQANLGAKNHAAVFPDAHKQHALNGIAGAGFGAAGQLGIIVPIPVPLPMFSFTSNKKSTARTGALNFYFKDGLRFYTQWKTVTYQWKAEDATSTQFGQYVLSGVEIM